MDEKIYWIWLQQALSYGSRKAKVVNHYYKNIKDFYSAGEREWRICGCFLNREIEALLSISLDKAKLILEKSYNLGYEILTLADEEYPKLLKDIPNPPCVLYINGDKLCLSGNLNISVVGTRKATSYGTEMAFEISRDLASAGAVVVSGGAIGVDFAAHEGALNGGGKTVAVLGCGINYPYLMNNASLREEISKSGAVISEYPPDFQASPRNFPIRNRIISGLSLGTVVIEAGEKSGSLITANLANDQNRDVFVVPIDMESRLAVGATGLIRDGATVITCAQNILDEYSKRIGNDFKIKKIKPTAQKIEIPVTESANKKLNLKSKNKKILNSLDNKSKIIYRTIEGEKDRMHIDDISRKTGLLIKDLLPIITELELYGLIKPCSGRMYEVNN